MGSPFALLLFMPSQTLNTKPTGTFTTQTTSGGGGGTTTAEKKRVSLEKLKEAEEWRLKGVKALKVRAETL